MLIFKMLENQINSKSLGANKTKGPTKQDRY
jgi:hypothetical protein